jgi:hypothetical protein
MTNGHDTPPIRYQSQSPIVVCQQPADPLLSSYFTSHSKGIIFERHKEKSKLKERQIIYAYIYDRHIVPAVLYPAGLRRR